MGLEIDGGVKLDNARRAVDAGATVLIAASGIFAGSRTRRRPHARGSPPTVGPQGRGSVAGCPRRSCVVDDDPDIARFVEVNLRSAGYDVAVAADGEEALSGAGELRPTSSCST